MRIVKIVLLVIVVLIGGVGIMMYFQNQKTPENLGVTSGKLAPMPSSPNAVSSQTDIEEKRVQPLPFKVDLPRSKESVLKALESYGGIQVITNTPNYVHAIHTTKTMRYRDDLEFYFDEGEQVVHFRSASRVGYSDRGLNRARYNTIAEYYQR